MYLSRLFRRTPPSGISGSGGRSSSSFPSWGVCPTSTSIVSLAATGTCSFPTASVAEVVARPCLCRATSSSSVRRASGARFTLIGRPPSSESTVRTSLGTNDCRVPMRIRLVTGFVVTSRMVLFRQTCLNYMPPSASTKRGEGYSVL